MSLKYDRNRYTADLVVKSSGKCSSCGKYLSFAIDPEGTGFLSVCRRCHEEWEERNRAGREAVTQKLISVWKHRTCDQCGEDIKRIAKICKHCHQPISDWQQEMAKVEAEKAQAKLWGCEPWLLDAEKGLRKELAQKFDCSLDEARQKAIEHIQHFENEKERERQHQLRQQGIEEERAAAADVRRKRMTFLTITGLIVGWLAYVNGPDMLRQTRMGEMEATFEGCQLSGTQVVRVFRGADGQTYTFPKSPGLFGFCYESQKGDKDFTIGQGIGNKYHLTTELKDGNRLEVNHFRLIKLIK